MHAPTCSIVVETYNLGEGAERALLVRAIECAIRCAQSVDGECLLVDTSDGNEVIAFLEAYPSVRRVPAVGLGYDHAKYQAALAAQSPYIVYLDGDCLPVSDDWLPKMLAPLQDGSHVAAGGYTRYAGGLFAQMCSVLDFGWFLERGLYHLGCYASNNVAFRRDVLVNEGAPEGPMRCRCFAHAQALWRAGTPVRFVEGALVEHAFPPFLSERLRQGYDTVASCWVNPALRQARWLRLGPLALVRFLPEAWRLDQQRLRQGRRQVGMSRTGRRIARVVLPFLRLIDAVGMSRALVFGPTSRFNGAVPASEACAVPAAQSPNKQSPGARALAANTSVG